MSQPYTRRPFVPQPAELDSDLGEFWSSNPWYIQQSHNLSAFERNRLFLNAAKGRFVDASFISGADSEGDGRSVVAADFRNNGKLDLVVRQTGGGALRLYENCFPKRSHLQVTLRGVQSNRLGVGAKLALTAAGRTQFRELFPRNTFTSQAPCRTHFGLADATRADRLAIYWPSGERQELENVPANLHIVVTEGASYEVVEPGETIAP